MVEGRGENNERGGKGKKNMERDRDRGRDGKRERKKYINKQKTKNKDRNKNIKMTSRLLTENVSRIHKRKN